MGVEKSGAGKVQHGHQRRWTDTNPDNKCLPDEPSRLRLFFRRFSLYTGGYVLTTSERLVLNIVVWSLLILLCSLLYYLGNVAAGAFTRFGSGIADGMREKLV